MSVCRLLGINKSRIVSSISELCKRYCHKSRPGHSFGQKTSKKDSDARYGRCNKCQGETRYPKEKQNFSYSRFDNRGERSGCGYDEMMARTSKPPKEVDKSYYALKKREKQISEQVLNSGKPLRRKPVNYLWWKTTESMSEKHEFQARKLKAVKNSDIFKEKENLGYGKYGPKDGSTDGCNYRNF